MSKEHEWVWLPYVLIQGRLVSWTDQRRECKRCGTIMSEMDFEMLAELFGIEDCDEAMAGRVIDA